MESTPQKLELITKYFDDFTPTQLEQFRLLEELYKEWNAKDHGKYLILEKII